MFAVLADKGYQGMRTVRLLSPKKRKSGENLLEDYETYNRNLSTDWIIFENFFGRMKAKWKITDHKWTFDKAFFPKVIDMCVALTNFHIKLHELRDDDGIYYRKWDDRLIVQGKREERRREKSRQKHLEKRKRQLQGQIPLTSSEGSN